MPHESTVEHTVDETINSEDDDGLGRARDLVDHKAILARETSITVPHLRAETPAAVTHHHDEDDFDEGDEESLQAENVQN